MVNPQPNQYDVARELHHSTTVIADQLKDDAKASLKVCNKELEKPSPKEYLGTTEREYKRDFAKIHATYGNRALNPKTDLEITTKLLMVGHQPKDIARTINKHSPNMARQIAKNGGKHYGENTVKAAWSRIQNNPKMRNNLDKIRSIQKPQSVNKVDRRLGSYGLAQPKPQTKKQSTTTQPQNSTQNNRKHRQKL